jgi:hypothetical protein
MIDLSYLPVLPAKYHSKMSTALDRLRVAMNVPLASVLPERERAKQKEDPSESPTGCELRETIVRRLRQFTTLVVEAMNECPQFNQAIRDDPPWTRTDRRRSTHDVFSQMLTLCADETTTGENGIQQASEELRRLIEYRSPTAGAWHDLQQDIDEFAAAFHSAGRKNRGRNRNPGRPPKYSQKMVDYALSLKEKDDSLTLKEIRRKCLEKYGPESVPTTVGAFRTLLHHRQ